MFKYNWCLKKKKKKGTGKVLEPVQMRIWFTEIYILYWKKFICIAMNRNHLQSFALPSIFY